MLRKTVSVLVLTLLLTSLSSSAVIVQPVKSEPEANKKILDYYTKILDPGDDLIHGFVYYEDYLWASTRTSPCRVLKIDLETLDYDRIILDAGLNYGEALISADGYIWVALDTSPCKIVRVDSETLVWEVAVTINELSRGASLEYAFGYLWAGAAYGKIARINLIDLTYELYSYPSAGSFSYFASLISGDGYIWATDVHYSYWQGRYYASTVIRFNPTNPSDYTSVYISGGALMDDVAFVGGHFYTGSETSPSYAYEISNSLTYSSAEISDTLCYAICASNNHIWGAYVGSPGKIVELDLNLNILATYLLPVGFNNANEIAFDAAGNMYVTCWESPAKIVKFTPSEASLKMLDVPYVHQCYDTPNDFNGAYACAPTCAVMVLAYWNRIPPDPIEVASPFGHESLYGKYVSSIYPYKEFTFANYATYIYICGEAEGYGAWGYIWQDETGTGIKNRLAEYIGHHDLLVQGKNEEYSSDEEKARRVVEKEINNERPLIALTGLSEEGHWIVIVGYEVDSNGVFWYIVNDPAGKAPYTTCCGSYEPQPVKYLYSEMGVRRLLCVDEFLQTDLNRDHTVNIVDISIIARAFGTREGNENYNVLADLDENGEVTIIDISAVARDYGKTV